MIVAIDADGTAINSMPMLTKLGVEIICKYTEMTEAEALSHYRWTMGRPFEEQLRMLPNEHRVPVIPALIEFDTRKKEAWLASSAFPGLRGILNCLRGRPGSSNAVLVSSTEPKLIMQWLRENSDLNMLVSPWRKAGALVGLAGRQRHVLFIGDTPYDAEVAEQLGIEFIGVRNTVRDWDNPDLTIVDNLPAAVQFVKRYVEGYLTWTKEVDEL